MKLLAALLAAVLSAVAVMILMLAELLAILTDLVARLAPLVVLGAIVWLVMRYRARPQPQPMGSADVMPVVARPIPTAAAPLPTSAPPESAGPAAATLPPKMPHYERFYLVRGDDTGLRSPRTDGYVKVAAPNLPAARPHPARRKSNVPRLERVSARRRPGTPRTRP